MVIKVQQMLIPVSGMWSLWLVMCILCELRVRCAPVSSSATLQCSDQNKDPCVTFPDLCSAGGGRCVVKGPCEYQCMCPPDGRVGRDCTSISNPQQQPSVVDTLLIFQKDIFLDANHLSKSEDLLRSHDSNVTRAATSQPKTTTSTQLPIKTWRETSTATQELNTTTSETPPTSSVFKLPSSANATQSETPLTETTTITPKNDTAGVGLVIPDQNIAAATSLSSVYESSTGSAKDYTSTSRMQNMNQSTSTVNVLPATTISGSTLAAEMTIHPSQPSTKAVQPSASVDLSDLPSTASYKQLSNDINSLGETRHTSPAAIQPMNTTSSSISNIDPNISLSSNASVNSDGSTQSPFTDVRQTTEGTRKPLQADTSNSSKLETKQNNEDLQSGESARPQIWNSNKTDENQTSTTQTLARLPEQSTLPLTSAATVQPDLITTRHQTTTTEIAVTSTHVSLSTMTSSQPNVVSTTTTNKPSPAEEFPTLFKVNEDNSLAPPHPGVNAPLFMVVHRVFVPMEKFPTGLRSRP